MALYVLKMIIDKEKNNTPLRFELLNASLFDIEMLWLKDIHYLSKQYNLDTEFGTGKVVEDN